VWEELSGVFSWYEVHWCMGLHFNVTRFSNERAGLTQVASAMWEFLDFILEQGLMDIPLVGGSFTWSNNQDSHLCPRLIGF
jgi:hypothetical protein